MTTIRRITVSQIDGNDANANDPNEIRPFGETAFYVDPSGEGNKLTLMMFDGQRTHLKSKVLAQGRLYGAQADAGDGSGADTIKLIPDAVLYDQGSNQYLVVDPTGGEPGHIHLRAGGVQDSSSADLYIGGEQTFVRVSDTNDNVVIRTSMVGEGVTPYTWLFDNTGKLTLPNGSSIESTAGNGIGLTTDRGTILFGNSPEIGGPSHFHIMKPEITTGVDLYFGDDHNFVLQRGTAYGSDPAYGVEIGASDRNGGSLKRWRFGTDGTTSFPSNKIKTSADNSLVIETESLPTEPPTTIVISGADFTAVNLTYNKDGANSTWYPAGYTPETDPYIEFTGGQYGIFVPGFGQALYVNTGTLNVPLTQWNTNPPLGSVAPTGVYTYPGTYTHAWTFGTNGSLSVPGSIKNTLTLGGEVVISTASTQGDTAKTWIFSHDGVGDLGLPQESGVSAIKSMNLSTYSPTFQQFVNLKDYDSLSSVDGTDINIINPQPEILALIDPTSPNFIGTAGAKVRIVHGYSLGDFIVTETTLTGPFALNGEDPLVPGVPRYTATIADTGVAASEIRQFGFGDSATWHFKSNGSLKLPTGGVLGYEGMGWPGFSNGTSQLPVSVMYKDNTGSTQSAITFSGGNNVDGSGSIIIDAYNFNTTTGYQWSFSANAGNMTFPGGATVKDLPGDGPDDSVLILGAGTTIAENQRAARIGINGSVEGVSIGAGSNDWSFTNGGTLTFPGGMTIDTEYGGTARLVIDGKNNGVDIRSNGNILIGYNSSGNVYIGNPNGGDQVDIVGSRFRVLVDVPTHSTGSAGDQVGQLAVDSSYIYYCFANFGTAPTETFTVLNSGEYNNLIRVSMAANPNYTVPTAGWYVTIGGVLMTLSAFSAPSGSEYHFLFDNSSGAPLPLTVTLTSPTGYTNIWKRLAWSGDTW